MSRSDFININQIELPFMDDIKHICFTFTIQPKQHFHFFNAKKNKLIKYEYAKLSRKTQCEMLSYGLPSGWYVYFEQHKDGRMHVHGYANTSVNKMNEYREFQFDRIRCTRKDIQNHLFLAEITMIEPAWIKYCIKDQDLFADELETLENNEYHVEEMKDYSQYLFK